MSYERQASSYCAKANKRQASPIIEDIFSLVPVNESERDGHIMKNTSLSVRAASRLCV